MQHRWRDGGQTGGQHSLGVPGSQHVYRTWCAAVQSIGRSPASLWKLPKSDGLASRKCAQKAPVALQSTVSDTPPPPPLTPRLSPLTCSSALSAYRVTPPRSGQISLCSELLRHSRLPVQLSLSLSTEDSVSLMMLLYRQRRGGLGGAITTITSSCQGRIHSRPSGLSLAGTMQGVCGRGGGDTRRL